jgi:hypothetical protein
MMGVKKLRRSYTKEFKLETVRLADTSVNLLLKLPLSLAFPLLRFTIGAGST